MKYLQRNLIYAGLCLLLICSANMASAQAPGVSVSSSQTVVSRTIDFTVNLSRQLGEDEAVAVNIRLRDIVQSEVESINPLGKDSTNLCRLVGGGFRFRRENTDPPVRRENTDPPEYSLCMDEGEQNVTIRLVLKDTFDTSRAIAISLFGGSYATPGSIGNIFVSSTLNILPPLEVSLERGTTTQTSMGLRIDFKVNLSRELTGSEVLQCTIDFNNIDDDEIDSITLVPPHPSSTNLGAGSSDPPRRDLRTRAGAQDTTIRLQLKSPPFDETKIISISLSGCLGSNIAEGVEEDLQNSILYYPDTVILIRSKVFLEGPLQ